MRERNKPFLFRLAMAFILANALFLSIFVFAYGISYLNYQEIKSTNSIISNYIDDFNLYLDESICVGSRLNEASEKLDIVGSKLDLLEDRFGKHDNRVLEQKKLYSDLEHKHMLIVNEFNEKCKGGFNILLFFYSNEGKLEEESKNMGFILGTYKKQNPEKAMIYSFDANLDYFLINELKEKNEIKNAPIAVIKGNKIYIRNINEIEGIIG